MKKIDLYGDEIGSVELIDHMGSDLTIVNSARVSFGKNKESLDEKDKKLIKYLVKHRHTSTFEHNAATFRFVVPLFIRSQHHRHRTWSYNEISRRYTDINMKFYVPRGFRQQHQDNRQASTDNIVVPLLSSDTPGKSPQAADDLVRAHHRNSINLYDKMIESGICREQARGVLPQNLYTEYYGTCNLNNLLKFIDLRIHDGAQWEIQKVAQAILEITTELWPTAVNSYLESKKG
jgi:thymidylate synthase (FAD)